MIYDRMLLLNHTSLLAQVRK